MQQGKKTKEDEELLSQVTKSSIKLRPLDQKSVVRQKKSVVVPVAKDEVKENKAGQSQSDGSKVYKEKIIEMIK